MTVQCFNPDIQPLDPVREDYSAPINVTCTFCGVDLPNITSQREAHQAFHDRVERAN